MTHSAQAPPPRSDPGPCPGDDVLLAFASGNIDAPLREHAEAHLAQCGDCRAVLAEAAFAMGETSGDAPSPERGVRRIGRYKLLDLLGAGSAGLVYRAFDAELERTVALKLLRSPDGNETAEAARATLREARAMAQVAHPNVVTVFDVGLDRAGVYIVMEYVQGTTLEAWLHKGPHTRDAILAAFIEAGQGLAALHDKRLVHRDFKPENVLVGKDGRVRVSDFGLARPLGTRESGNLHVPSSAELSTRTRGIFGTPAYMAPELFAGHAADAKSDQFGFCVALWRALAGRHPFGAEDELLLSELVTRIHSARIDASRLPRALRPVLLRGISVLPGERFADMAELIAALRAARAGARTRTRRIAGAVLAGLSIAAGASALLPHAFAGGAAAPSATASRMALALPAATAVRSRSPNDEPSPRADAGTSTHEPGTGNRPAPRPGRKRYHDGLKEPF